MLLYNHHCFGIFWTRFSVRIEIRFKYYSHGFWMCFEKVIQWGNWHITQIALNTKLTKVWGVGVTNLGEGQPEYEPNLNIHSFDLSKKNVCLLLILCWGCADYREYIRWIMCSVWRWRAAACRNLGQYTPKHSLHNCCLSRIKLL